MIRLGPYGDNGGAVFDVRGPSFRFYPGAKVADVAGGLGNGAIRIDMNGGMLINALRQIADIGLNVHPVQGVVDVSGHPAQV